jgi:CheY-like chemotaxis protein
LEQVVRNLLSNAMKFTPEGGRVEVCLEQRDSLAEIRVRDWGEGIAADFLPHVFEPFRQADATPSRRHGGLGLGLAIVQQVVELHEGAVDAHSDGLGTGTTFTVRIPLLAGALARSDESSESAGEAIDRLRGLRVLLVEDNADTRDMLAVLLQSHGAEVRAAASAQEALASFRLHRPDVLLCDIGLPLEDGYSLIRQIRSLRAEEGGRVPALALSAYTRFEDRQQALAAGFQMHLPKPINPLLVIRSLADLSRGGGVTTEEAGAPRGSKRNFRIVVIDDAKDLADIFGIVLREMGHEVHVFYDGLTALSQAGGIQPEIIFSDISMREMNGYELAKRLREMPGLRDVILVAITGFSQAEGDHLLRAGFDCHMVKPVLGAQLKKFFSQLSPRPARQ